MSKITFDQFPHPRANPDWHGQQVAEQDLLSAHLSNRMPHAWLFTGPKGIGKATLAYRFARFLLANSNRPETPTDLSIHPTHITFQQIASGGHNDLKAIDATGDDKKTETIAVDDIRAVAPFLRLTAGQEGWRIVVIDGADTMNRNAQNALLKILEEPGPHSLLLLTAENPGILLPTIRSRTRSLKLQPESNALERLQHDLPDDDRAILEFLSNGSLGNAVRILQNDGIKHFHDACDLLSKIRDPLAIHRLGDIYAKADNEAWHWFSTSLLQILYTAALQKSIPALEPFTASRTALIMLRDKAVQLFDELNRFHLDKKQAILSLAGLVREYN